MRVVLTSDTHIGLTSERSLRKVFREAAGERPDLLVHAGDYCGGKRGARSVRSTIKLMREYFPDTPILSVIGNHDFYNKPTRHHPNVSDFEDNYQRILETFREYDVRFLDEEHLYIHPQFPELVFIGHTGWYSNPNPPTNDRDFLPLGMDGDTNQYLLRRAYRGLHASLEALENKGFDSSWQSLIFVSHFPVIKTEKEDYKGTFEQFSWSAGIGDMLRNDYSCKYFLCGHSHQRHSGPLRYEAGSDYYKPNYLTINI